MTRRAKAWLLLLLFLCLLGQGELKAWTAAALGPGQRSQAGDQQQHEHSLSSPVCLLDVSVGVVSATEAGGPGPAGLREALAALVTLPPEVLQCEENSAALGALAHCQTQLR